MLLQRRVAVDRTEARPSRWRPALGMALGAALLLAPAASRAAVPVRLQAGFAAVGGGAACSDSATTNCPPWEQLAAATGVLAAQVDLFLRPTLTITPGLSWSFAPWRSEVPNLLTPSVDVGWVRHDPDRQVRLTLGVEAPIDSQGQVGVGGRFGLGATLLSGPVPGLAFDVSAGIAEVGGRASPSLRLLIGVQFGG
jgi:hypothetical protein